MAEAVVSDRPGPPPRFYCHVCKQEFTDITQEYTCPVCSDGFIEELHDADPSSASSSASNSNSSGMDVLDMLNTGFRDGGGELPDGAYRVLRQPPSATDPRGRPIRRPTAPSAYHNHHHHHHHHHPRMGPPSHPAVDGAAPPAPPAMINAYDQLIRDFFAYVGVPAGGVTVQGGGNVGGGGGNTRRLVGGGGSEAPGGSIMHQMTMTPMFFLGNPGDYVWGHDGLDSVITLMLNQLEPTGPPPMSAAKIDEIPKCSIGQEQLDKKMQCSVCLEDFQLDEQCRKLPCAHIFHETCILPWLELHGTCPICRDTFTEEQQQAAAAAAATSTATGAEGGRVGETERRVDGDDEQEAMDIDAAPPPPPPPSQSGPTRSGGVEAPGTAISLGTFLADIRRPGGVMNVLASHLPRVLADSLASSSATSTGEGGGGGGGGAGIIGSGGAATSGIAAEMESSSTSTSNSNNHRNSSSPMSSSHHHQSQQATSPPPPTASQGGSTAATAASNNANNEANANNNVPPRSQMNSFHLDDGLD